MHHFLANHPLLNTDALQVALYRHWFSPSYFKLCFVVDYNRRAICLSRTAFGTQQHVVREQCNRASRDDSGDAKSLNLVEPNKTMCAGRTVVRAERGWVTRQRRRRETWWENKNEREESEKSVDAAGKW